jgi:hypothetical protein
LIAFSYYIEWFYFFAVVYFYTVLATNAFVMEDGWFVAIGLFFNDIGF